MKIKLMYGDCIERMKEIPDNSIVIMICPWEHGVN